MVAGFYYWLSCVVWVVVFCLNIQPFSVGK